MEYSTYTPSPLDTSGIELPAAAAVLAEAMAKNTHEVWAAARINEGWRFGPVRDDARKLHPCLVPYEQLSDAEKEYDRRTSAEAIRFLLASGCDIVRRQ